MENGTFAPKEQCSIFHNILKNLTFQRHLKALVGSKGLMCLAQGHNAVTPVSLEPTAPQSQVKHSTTEPLRSRVAEASYP